MVIISEPRRNDDFFPILKTKFLTSYKTFQLLNSERVFYIAVNCWIIKCMNIF